MTPAFVKALDQIDGNAAKVLELVKHAAALIRAQRKEMDDSGRHDETLYVLGGESHAQIYNVLFHMLVLKELQAEEPSIAVAYEREHDVLKKRREEHAGKSGLDSTDDSKGHLSLKAQAKLYRYFTPQLNMLMSNFLIEEDFPVVMTDVSYKALGQGRLVVDFNCSSAQKSAERTFKRSFDQSAEDISTSENDGHKIRDDHMANFAMDYVAQHKPRILYNRIGYDHVIGAGFPNGIFGHLKSAGAEVIGFTVAKDLGEETIEGIHVIEGLPELSAAQQYQCDLNFEAEESCYLEKLFKAVGLEDFYIEENGVYDLYKRYEQDIAKSSIRPSIELV